MRHCRVLKRRSGCVITNQTITIRTSTKEEKKEEEKGKYFRREITRGEFQRTLSLPDNVDGDNAKASFKDGILKVNIPKQKKVNVKPLKSNSPNFTGDLFLLGINHG